jgi:hypothetical protein
MARFNRLPIFDPSADGHLSPQNRRNVIVPNQDATSAEHRETGELP